MLSIPSYTGQSARCFSPCNRSRLYTPPDTERPPNSLHHPKANPSASFCHNRYISVPRPLCWWACCLLVCSSRPVTHGLKQKLTRKTARTANKLLAWLHGRQRLDEKAHSDCPTTVDAGLLLRCFYYCCFALLLRLCMAMAADPRTLCPSIHQYIVI